MTAPGLPQTAVEPVEFEQKIGFLYKALDDNQGIIRLLDAKAAFAVIVLSAMIGRVLGDLSRFLPHAPGPLWPKVGFGLFGISVVLAGLLVFKLIFPVTNPSENVRLMNAGAKPLFFIWGLVPRSWWRFWSRSPRFSVLALEQEVYLRDLDTATEGSLLTVLSGEVLKVSYIRQVKADRLRALGWLLVVSAVLFMILMAAEQTVPATPDAQKIRIEGPVEIQNKSAAPAPPPQASPPAPVPPAGAAPPKKS